MEKLYSIEATINFEDSEVETSAELLNLGAVEDFVARIITDNNLASSFVFVIANH